MYFEQIQYLDAPCRNTKFVPYWVKWAGQMASILESANAYGWLGHRASISQGKMILPTPTLVVFKTGG